MSEHDYSAMLGQSLASDGVSALLDALGPCEQKTYPAVGKHPASEYHSAKSRGVQLCFEASGALPHGLSFAHNNVQVVEMLGEPHNKGGNNVPVWIEYQDKGLQINFKGLSFEDRTNPIASITIFPPDPSAGSSVPAGAAAAASLGAAQADASADMRRPIGVLLDQLDSLD